MYVGVFAAYAFLLLGNYIDSIIGGRVIGEDAVSAISVISPFFSIIVFFSGFFSIGTATVYFQHLGRFEPDEGSHLLGRCLIFNAGIGALLLLVFGFGGKYFISLFDLSAEIEILANEYFFFYAFIALVYPLYWMVYTLVQEDGDALICFISDLTQIIINIAVSLLTVGSLGIRGLGLGTFISVVVGSFVLVIHFFRKTNAIKFSFGRCVKQDISNSVMLGASSLLANLFTAIVGIVLNRFIIARIGDEYLAAYSITSFVIGFCTIFSSPVEASAGFLSVYYGEHNNDGVRSLSRLSIGVALALGILFTLALELFAPIIPHIYNIETPEIYQAAVTSCRILGVSMIPAAFVYLGIGYYPIIGQNKLSLLLVTLYMLINSLFLALPFGWIRGINGISIGLALSPIISIATASLIAGIKNGWKKFPLFLEDTEFETKSFDIIVSSGNTVVLRDKVEEFLSEKGVSPKASIKICLLIEELYVKIEDMNPGKKICSECTVMVNENKHMINLITRDNGVIFDITDSDNDVLSLNSFVLASLMEHHDNKNNLTTTSFNRNSFIFEY